MAESLKTTVDSFVKAIHRDSTDEIKQKAYIFLGKILENVKKSQRITKDFDIEHALEAIETFILSQHYVHLQNSEPSFEEQIYEIIQQTASKITPKNNKDHVFEIFKISWNISISIVKFETISKWRFLISDIFNSGSPQKMSNTHNMKGDMKEFYRPRFEHIFTHTSGERKEDSAAIWWDIIFTSIMPFLLDFNAIDDKGEILFPGKLSSPQESAKSQPRRNKMTDEMRYMFLKFLSRSQVREELNMYRKKTTQVPIISNGFVNALTCLIAFFEDAGNNQKFVEGSEILLTFWDELPKEDKINITKQINNSSPNKIPQLLNAYARNASLQLLKSHNENSWNSVIELRRQWCSVLKTPVEIDVIKNICNQFNASQKLITVVIFYTFIYDMKYTNKNYMCYFPRDSMIAEMRIVIKKILSIFGVALSPFFLGLSRDKLKEYGDKTKQRNSRSQNFSKRSPDEPEDPYENLVDIFDNPNKFEELLQNNEQEKSEFKGINSKVTILSFNSDGWTYEIATEFITNLIHSFAFKEQPSFFNSFIHSLSTVRDFVPISLQQEPRRIASTFFKMALDMCKEGKEPVYECDMLTAIAYSAKQVGIISRSNIDPDDCNEWVSIIIMYLCNTPEIVTCAIPTAVSTIIQFAPHSFILTQLIPTIIINDSTTISLPLVYSFIITTFSIFNSVKGIKLPKKITDNIVEFKKKLKNVKTFQIMNGQTKDVPSIVKNTIVHVPFKLDLCKNNNDVYIFIYFCLLIEDILSKNPCMIDVFKTFMDELSKEQNSFSLRELLFLAMNADIFDESIQNASSILIKKLMSIARYTNDNSKRRMILKSCAFASLKSFYEKDAPMKIFINKMKKHKSEFEDVVDSLVYEIAQQSPPPLNDCHYQVIISTPDNVLYGISGMEDTKFTLSSRSSSSFTQMDVESIERSTAQEDFQLPPCETEEEEEEEEISPFDFTSLLSEYTNKDKAACDANNAEVKEKILREAPEGTPLDNSQLLQNNAIEEELQENEQRNEEPKDGYSKFMTYLSESSCAKSFISCFTNVKDSLVQEASKNLLRKSTPAFALPTRECIKIGVIYVGNGQLQQNEILGNTHQTASMKFHNFLNALGTPVDIRNHKWYLGKLEGQSYNDFPYSIYYSDQQYEVMFHVSTLLPHNDDDTQHILKKKHIGNDNVHIVWCENESGYDTTVITSQFNDAHIVIYPFNVPSSNISAPGSPSEDMNVFDFDENDCSLYHVLIKRKDAHMKNVGPLPDESLVMAKALPILVRETAMMHDRAARAKLEVQSDEQFQNLMDSIAN